MSMKWEGLNPIMENKKCFKPPTSYRFFNLRLNPNSPGTLIWHMKAGVLVVCSIGL